MEDLPAGTNLNPNAPEWHPGLIPKESRSLFMTFSMGHPLTKDELEGAFTRQFGDCLVDVDIYKPNNGGQSLFGRLIFKTVYLPAFILNGQREMQVLVCGRSIVLKKFRTQRT